MLRCCGRGVQMVQVETIMTAVVDRWSSLGRSAATRFLAAVAVCGAGLLIGIPMTTQVEAPHTTAAVQPAIATRFLSFCCVCLAASVVSLVW